MFQEVIRKSWKRESCMARMLTCTQSWIDKRTKTTRMVRDEGEDIMTEKTSTTTTPKSFSQHVECLPHENLIRANATFQALPHEAENVLQPDTTSTANSTSATTSDPLVLRRDPRPYQRSFMRDTPVSSWPRTQPATHHTHYHFNPTFGGPVFTGQNGSRPTQEPTTNRTTTGTPNPPSNRAEPATQHTHDPFQAPSFTAHNESQQIPPFRRNANGSYTAASMTSDDLYSWFTNFPSWFADFPYVAVRFPRS